jgi:hypothetical protein
MTPGMGLVPRVLGGLQVLFLMAAVVLAVPLAIVAALIVVIMFQRGGTVVHNVYPSPDRRVSLLVETDLGGGPTVAPANFVYLVGERFAEPAKIGRYFHGGWASTNGWTDPGTFNLCDLAGYTTVDDAPTTSIVMKGADGAENVYRITLRCPPGYFGNGLAREERR